MSKRTLLFILISVLLLIIFLFATGSSVLTKNVVGIPLGNIMVWIGFISLQFLVFTIKNRFKSSNSIIGKIIRFLMKTLIVISILWFGIAYILSGNINFNFSSNSAGYFGSPKASILYWNIIYALVISPIILMIAYTLLRFYERLKASK